VAQTHQKRGCGQKEKEVKKHAEKEGMGMNRVRLNCFEPPGSARGAKCTRTGQGVWAKKRNERNPGRSEKVSISGTWIEGNNRLRLVERLEREGRAQGKRADEMGEKQYGKHPSLPKQALSFVRNLPREQEGKKSARKSPMWIFSPTLQNVAAQLSERSQRWECQEGSRKKQSERTMCSS